MQITPIALHHAYTVSQLDQADRYANAGDAEVLKALTRAGQGDHAVRAGHASRDSQPLRGSAETIEDRVEISPTARKAHQRGGSTSAPEADDEQLRQMRAQDREIRAHEQAHQAAAGTLASGSPSYSYERGPDGKQYAVGGEVQIQLREGRNPEETLRNAQQAQRAAMAPANPSPQDRAVAARAVAMAAEARREIQQQQKESVEGPAPAPTQPQSLVSPAGNTEIRLRQLGLLEF